MIGCYPARLFSGLAGRVKPGLALVWHILSLFKLMRWPHLLPWTIPAHRDVPHCGRRRGVAVAGSVEKVGRVPRIRPRTYVGRITPVLALVWHILCGQEISSVPFQADADDGTPVAVDDLAGTSTEMCHGAPDCGRRRGKVADIRCWLRPVENAWPGAQSVLRRLSRRCRCVRGCLARRVDSPNLNDRRRRRGAERAGTLGAEQHTPMAGRGSQPRVSGEVPECRRDRGKRYRLNTVLAIAVAPVWPATEV